MMVISFPAVKDPSKVEGAKWVTSDIDVELTVDGPQEDIPVEHIIYHKTTSEPTIKLPTPTGDTNNIKLWAGVMGISSLVAIILLVIVRRKIKRK